VSQLHPFNKPSTTYAEQLDKLTARGMTIADTALAERWLKTVGYYRLGAYWLTFEKPPAQGQTRSKRFVDGTTFEQVINLYTFDRELRLLVTEAIERTEIALRASWTYQLGNAHGPHAYLDPNKFEFDLDYHQQVNRISSQVRRSSETFVKHYRRTYYPPTMPPLWIVTELMTFGEISKWVEKTRENFIKLNVARDMGFPNMETLTGTIASLSYVRNICAHHGRLWNRRLVKRPPYLRLLSASLQGTRRNPNEIDNTIFNILTILVYLLRKQSPDTSFAERVIRLADTQPDYIRQGMGIPDDWKSRPIWK